MPDCEKQKRHKLTQVFRVEELEPFEDVAECKCVCGHVERFDQSPEGARRFILRYIDVKTTAYLPGNRISRNAVHNTGTFGQKPCGEVFAQDDLVVKS